MQPDGAQQRAMRGRQSRNRTLAGCGKTPRTARISPGRVDAQARGVQRLAEERHRVPLVRPRAYSSPERFNFPQLLRVAFFFQEPLHDLQLHRELADLRLHSLEIVEWFLGKKGDRKSTRLNSSHVRISYAVLCLYKRT